MLARSNIKTLPLLLAPCHDFHKSPKPLLVHPQALKHRKLRPKTPLLLQKNQTKTILSAFKKRLTHLHP